MPGEKSHLLLWACFPEHKCFLLFHCSLAAHAQLERHSLCWLWSCTWQRGQNSGKGRAAQISAWADNFNMLPESWTAYMFPLLFLLAVSQWPVVGNAIGFPIFSIPLPKEPLKSYRYSQCTFPASRHSWHRNYSELPLCVKRNFFPFKEQILSFNPRYHLAFTNFCQCFPHFRAYYKIPHFDVKSGTTLFHLTSLSSMLLWKRITESFSNLKVIFKGHL